MRCPRCGAESAGDLSICSNCGTKLGARWQQRVRCPSCGRYAASGLRVCPSCSATLRTKRHDAGVWLLGILAALALTYNVATYSIGFDPRAEADNLAAKASATLTTWRERASTLLQFDLWERVRPLFRP